MHVILHIGAHRTGTTSFQDYMRRHSGGLTQARVGFWGPGRTRKGAFCGLFPDSALPSRRDLTQRAMGRIRMQLAQAREAGLRHLVISDENMLGSVRYNIRARQLYPQAGARMARFAQAFDGLVSRIVVSSRSPELYWASALGYGVMRGHSVPGAQAMDQIAQSDRSWRDVIGDVADAMPGVPVHVAPFEHYAGRASALLRDACGVDTAPFDASPAWLNRAPTLPALRARLAERSDGALQGLPEGDGRWHPFDTGQRAALRERYADDMMWLTAGADGMATLTEDRARRSAAQTLPPGAIDKGQDDERQERQLA